MSNIFLNRSDIIVFHSPLLNVTLRLIQWTVVWSSSQNQIW